MRFADRLKQLCAEEGAVTPDQLFDALIAKSGHSMGKLRIKALMDGGAPAFSDLRDLSVHFGVDMEYLAGKSDVRSTAFGRAAADAEDAEVNAWVENMLKVCEAIRAKHPKAKKNDPRREAFNQGRRKADTRDTMSCPICTTGTLAYAISGYNGHIHAKCSTANCIAFMQ